MLDLPDKTEALLDAMERALPFEVSLMPQLTLAYQKHRVKKLNKQH